MATSTQTTISQGGNITVTGIPSGKTSAQVVFYKEPEDGAAPYNWVATPPEGEPRTNIRQLPKDIPIGDIRGHEKDFSLNGAGFEVIRDVKSGLDYKDWEDDKIIEDTYYKEVEQLLLNNVPGAKRVFIFDHTIRRTEGQKDVGANPVREPVLRAHIDQTTEAGLMRVKHHLPEEADELLKDRVRIINVWRPLAGPLRAWPLAMADSSTVKADELVSVQHRYADRTGFTAGVKHSDAQQWWYLSGMDTDERILLQCFDTHGSKARVAHTAFKHPDSPPEAGRESIEVRTLVFG